MSLSDEQLERYSRQVILPEIGIAGQQRLLAARVFVPGCAPGQETAAAYLAASGVNVDRTAAHDGQRFDCALLGPDCLTTAATLLASGTPFAWYRCPQGRPSAGLVLRPSDGLPSPEPEPTHESGGAEAGLEQAAACEAACLCLAFLLELLPTADHGRSPS